MRIRLLVFVLFASAFLSGCSQYNRILKGKEHVERNGERLGHASLPRPEGTLIWVHGASVGECVAALPLILAAAVAYVTAP